MTIIENVYRPVTLRMDGSFHKFGEEITKILTKYPMTNPIWMVNGEEFITSYANCAGDMQLRDPWVREFSDEMLKQMVTVNLPEKHIRIPTSVEGITLMCNVYFRKLNTLEVNCKECKEKSECVECFKTLRKIVCFPQVN